MAKKNPLRKLLTNINHNSLRYNDEGKLIGGSGNNQLYAKICAGEAEIDENTPPWVVKNYQRNPNFKLKINYLTLDDLHKKWEQQGGKCYWLGIPLDPFWIYEKHHPGALSCDRLDDDGDYTVENTVICARDANLGRQSASVASYTEWMKYVKSLITNTGIGFDHVAKIQRDQRELVKVNDKPQSESSRFGSSEFTLF